MVDGEGQNKGSVALAVSGTDQPSCGVIMPISATANRSEKQWRDTQTLLHRGIVQAGFKPRNVWDSTASDRISERIIGSIFEVPIAVADISDLNPNVMLELGLRLSSRKPTIVVAELGCEIPFDIRDFHATFYPSDLNMLGMEEFFRKLGKVLHEKYVAFGSPGYTPFLGNVIVDVASPETREVGVNELLLSRLDEIASRITDFESSIKHPRIGRNEYSRPINGKFTVEIPEVNLNKFENDAIKTYEIDQIERLAYDKNGNVTLDVHYSGNFPRSHALDVITRLAQECGGDLDVPF